MTNSTASAPSPATQPDWILVADSLADIGRSFYDRGWALGTSGNFSAVLRSRPLQLAITGTGLDKGRLSRKGIVVVDESGKVVEGVGAPSAEVALHLAIAQTVGAGAVFHTHSVWSTVLAEFNHSQGGISIKGYEMLKGLSGIRTHEHREWLPILENSQDCNELARTVTEELGRNPQIHGFLLYRHGLYTWGADLEEAKRHVEILEFLLEVLGRSRAAKPDIAAAMTES
ncbi:MAG TPA: methylthioribulose 1-phosphate dehydratase [Terriglobales bacterium]|nr:methylthioribulose 1-phosphate dehydratase [Terriglobales bacterium]